MEIENLVVWLVKSFNEFTKVYYPSCLYNLGNRKSLFPWGDLQDIVIISPT